MDVLQNSVEQIKGVGPKRLEKLKRLNIFTIGDLLNHLPRDYIDRGDIKPISEVTIGQTETVTGQVEKVRLRRLLRWRSILEVSISDDSGQIVAAWFGRPHMKDAFHKGDTIVLWGKVTSYDHMQMVAPEFEIIPEGGEAAFSDGVVPIYPLTEELRHTTLRRFIKDALDKFADSAEDIFDEETVRCRDLMPVAEAYRNAHFPSSHEACELALRRLRYEEIFLFQVGMALRRRDIKSHSRHYQFSITDDIDKRIRRRIPFDLTNSQEKVVAEIRRDMEGPVPMNRLLQGDVGSGKTAVAVYAMLVAIANKTQTALMAPTEILAEQHYLTLHQYLAESKVRMVLLRGGMPASTRRECLKRIASGEVDLVVGTHAVIQDAVKFERLGLAVVDEQHKFGVVQRARLRLKGQCPDVLVMTATPIPRSICLTVFGDLDLSVLDEMPPGRHPIETSKISSKGLPKAYNFVRKEAEAGRQAYIIYPLVEESDKLDLRAATEMADELQQNIFPDLRVGLLHGQMGTAEKEAVMTKFRDGEYHILVCTVVVEVGIDVPNASVMLIEHAERFGLAQLHQLRGRIGRGAHRSFCFLQGDPRTQEARQRLKVLVETQDGFRIAEEDLKIRGPGEFFGIRQHGMPELRTGALTDDFPLLQLARKDAFDMVANDPKLDEDHHLAIRQAVFGRFGAGLALADVG